jgi:hydrogenase maturation protein HypF
VQGVGFRPFIYRLANTCKLSGWISNALDGVHIEVEGLSDASVFCQRIRDECPEQARIDNLSFKEVPLSKYNEFSIIESRKQGEPDIQLTPDFALCEDCLKELREGSNRRYAYPFITCTNCGPRFSITRKLPYDRYLTTMEPFKQCEACSNEFQDPEDRRFYSQTNSCPDCSIKLILYDKDRIAISGEQEKIIEAISIALLSGKIVAVKGIGGYLLCADATSSDVISTLRKRKKRPAKPFALMYPDIDTAKRDVILTNKVMEEWNSPESPIVLCRLKKDHSSGIKNEIIAPGLNRIGIMMPYAPLFILLMDKIRKPIVATSGNVSGSPIIFKDQEALEVLSEIADLILVNDREILVPQDDSVIQYSELSAQKIILRRSRGMAPSFSFSPRNRIRREVLAMGAMLKSTFGMIHMNRYYISQYLGDTSTLESQLSYETSLEHMMNILSFSPSAVLTDLHPDYPSADYGIKIATRLKIPLIKVQHHEAHSYAVLGENDLLEEDRVLTVIWDGTGYGKDGQVWGGEFFNYSRYKHTRVGHWAYYPHILGDKMSREPRISALCLTNNTENATQVLKNKFQSAELDNYNRLLNKTDFYTSSVGRLFDGVSSLLGFTDYNTYEGEAAMYLQASAIEYLEKNREFNDKYLIEITLTGHIVTQDLFAGVIKDKLDGKEAGYISAKFHYTMVHVIENFLETYSYRKVAFSGGVFQNNLLVDLINELFSGKYSVYFHKDLSPNDECIPFGQLIAWELLTIIK